MITRPLDLAAKLRPEPRSCDWLFFVNGGLIVMFFSLFGSKFVLAPALGLDFQLPVEAGAMAEARPPTSFISVTSSGQIFAGDGLRTIAQLQGWLRQEVAAARRPPVLLVRANRGVRVDILTEITSVARSAGFTGVLLAAVEPAPAGAGRVRQP
jgi:biopolymer transport protein ExbD